MLKIITEQKPAVVRGILAAGVGKKGSRALEPELIDEIIIELKNGTAPVETVGALFGGLAMKGITSDERRLECHFPAGTLSNPQALAKALTSDAPAVIQKLCGRLLASEELNRHEAFDLGKFLLSDLPGNGARGLVASILRVRYETPEEYVGLLAAIQQTIEPAFRTTVPAGDPVIQIAEPFDGVDHSYLITPLIARHLQTLGYRSVMLAGRNSGPKFGNNLFDLAQALALTTAKSNIDLVAEKPSLGWVIGQPDLSTALDRWVEIRRRIVKRPFPATLERFLNPGNAKIVVASAFHPPYGEKMMTVAENAGFPAAIIVRNGLEGTMAFPLKRPVKILCSAKEANGNYRREEITLNPADFLGEEIPVEEKLEFPSLEENARLIRDFEQKNKTNNDLFDKRVQFTTHGLTKAVRWIENVWKEPIS